MIKLAGLYKFLIFLYFLQSLRPWFLWGVPGGVIGLLCLAIVPALLLNKRVFGPNYMRKMNLLIPISGFFAFYLSMGDRGLLEASNIMILYINSMVLVLTTDNFKRDLGKYITNSFVIILIPSFLFFVIFLLYPDLPNLGPADHELGYRNINYFWFLYSPVYLFRFHSVFLEPGHLGMTIVFLLYINGMNFRNAKNWFLLGVLVATLSLAGYILFIVGYVFLIVAKSNFWFVFKKFIGFGVLLLFLVVFFSKYNSGDNFVYYKVISRLAFDQDRNTLAGDNRVTYNVNQYLSNADIGVLLFGIGEGRVDLYGFRGTGIKLFVLRYGIVAIFVIFLFYLSLLLKKTSFAAGLFLLLFSLSFIQRDYALWSSQLFIFIISLSVFTPIKDSEF